MPINQHDQLGRPGEFDEPQTVLVAEGKERIFNTAVCRGSDQFILLYETDDAKYPAFTFKYCESDDLVHWQLIPTAFTAPINTSADRPCTTKEIGSTPSTSRRFPDVCYETRIPFARSEAVARRAGRIAHPHVRPQPQESPFAGTELEEKNASDAELCYFHGKTIVYFTGSDQQVAGDLQRAEFTGTPRQLFESFVAGIPTPGKMSGVAAHRWA